MHNTSKAEAKFALNTVLQASKLVNQVQTELTPGAITKDDRSPVTVADFASQALVGYLLSETFPNDPLVAEEDSSALRDPAGRGSLENVTSFVTRFVSGVDEESVCGWIDRGNENPSRRFWTLDPIDGTKGFLRGDQYAVAFALIEDGVVQLGVLGCPNLSDGFRPEPGGRGSLVIALRGQGTWMTSLVEPGEFVRMHTSEQTNPAQMRILRSYEAGHTNINQVDQLAQMMRVQAEPVRMDSQAKYAVLAAGKGDLLVRLLSRKKPDYREKIWDQAAGSLVVEEAGGRITDLHGKPLDFAVGRTLADNRGVLASNGHYHPTALRALQDIQA
jgi:3'(2'), 5'-bisphosphate nucleotidase